MNGKSSRVSIRRAILEVGLESVSGFGFRVSGFGFRVSGFGFQVSGFEFGAIKMGRYLFYNIDIYRQDFIIRKVRCVPWCFLVSVVSGPDSECGGSFGDSPSGRDPWLSFPELQKGSLW